MIEEDQMPKEGEIYLRGYKGDMPLSGGFVYVTIIGEGFYVTPEGGHIELDMSGEGSLTRLRRKGGSKLVCSKHIV